MRRGRRGLAAGGVLLLLLVLGAALLSTAHAFVAPSSQTQSLPPPSRALPAALAYHTARHRPRPAARLSLHRREGATKLRSAPGDSLLDANAEGDDRGVIIDVSSSNSNSKCAEETPNGGFLEKNARVAARRLRQTAQSARRLFGLALSWHRTKGRRLVTMAALALSLVFASQDRIGSYVDQQSSAAAGGAEISRVAPAPALQQHRQSSSAIRGGADGKKRAVVKAVAKKQGKQIQEGVASASRETSRTLVDAMVDLRKYMQGPKSDTLFLLLATALVTPLCKRIGISPILGFLAAGMAMGPNGCGLISGIHTTETLAELGIVFFLFEMGIELSFDRLLSMRKDVFGLGLSQFSVTALAVAGVGKLVGLPANALVVLGGGLALSSSAFVLQLLKDKQQLATRFGRASFGVLLFQDLAVVPLLVVTPILAGTGASLGSALGSALIKASIALGSIAFAGRVVLDPFFKLVAQAQSQEAFLGVILLTVLSMSFMTEGLGLSNTLGAFLAGVLLSETKYRFQVEADIAPFRGILLGLFFVTVGFEIDIHLIASNFPLVGSLVLGILFLKTAITTALSLAFGLSLSTSSQTGLILSQGGEFAFVAFGLARSLGILDVPTTKLMLTSVSLTMALTPFMSSLGGRISKALEEKSDFTHYLGQDRDANEIKESDDFAVVVGYGSVGKCVCDLLDRKFIKYVGIELDPNKAIQARNQGLPVFYGDVGRQEVADAFNIGKASAVIVCIADKAQANRALIALRRFYPDINIFARAADADHASRLQNTLNVAAMVPILPEDNMLLTLPFGGAVMKALGVPSEEVNAILETRRKELLFGTKLEENEQELALLQLGIDVVERKEKEKEKIAATEKAAAAALVSSKNQTEVTSGDEEGKGGGEKEQRLPARVEAAAERRGEAKEKSPFVAQVIEEICPDSICESDDTNKEEPEELLVKVTPDGEREGLLIADTEGGNTVSGESSESSEEADPTSPGAVKDESSAFQ